MKKALISLLTVLSCWQPLASANILFDESLFQHELSAATELSLEPYYQLTQPDRTDLWMNATYALGASALSNTLLMIIIAGLSLGQEALAPEANSYLDMSGPSTLGLLVVPMIATPFLMHTWSPKAEWEHFNGSVLGSVALSGAQLVLMTPLFIGFNQGNINDTYWALLPMAFITSVLLQALGASWGHELSQNFSLNSFKGQGLQLTYQLQF